MPDTPLILPCLCGDMPKMEQDRPLGRMTDLHRVACACGQGSALWSASIPGAIRLWNSLMTSLLGRQALLSSEGQTFDS